MNYKKIINFILLLSFIFSFCALSYYTPTLKTYSFFTDTYQELFTLELYSNVELNVQNDLDKEIILSIDGTTEHDRCFAGISRVITLWHQGAPGQLYTVTFYGKHTGDAPTSGHIYFSAQRRP